MIIFHSVLYFYYILLTDFFCGLNNLVLTTVSPGLHMSVEQESIVLDSF
jgi:hypothetical protein